ncbi:hypothetical protein BSF42_40800 [Flavobacterium sp. ACN6]|nr:hypothetical protein BSF42_40800 [Flavobacterium sp. ACN6]
MRKALIHLYNLYGLINLGIFLSNTVVRMSLYAVIP